MDARAGTVWWIRLARIAAAILGAAALIAIPVRDLGTETFTWANYFSYFTIQSNIFGVVVLLVGGTLDPGGRRAHPIRAAATLYLAITAVIYAVLLADLDTDTGDRWINDVLHRVIPFVVIADWLLAPVRLAVTARLVAALLVYPSAFAAYTLLRGRFVDWYPYPFLDPRGRGYVSLLLGIVVLAIVFALLAVAVLVAGGWAARRRTPVR